MRFVFVLAVLAAWVNLLGDASTAPSTQPDSVADQVARWQDAFETKTPDQVLGDYAVHSADEAKLARAMADEGVACSRLVKLVRQTWGGKAEMDVAHACFTDCRADDAVSSIVLVGNHATMSFRAGTISPFLLVHENGHWLIDVGSYLQLIGPNLDQALQDTQRYGVVDRTAADSLSNGKYASADDLLADLNKQSAPATQP